MAGGFRPLVPPVTSCRCGHFPLTLPGSFPSFAMDAQTSQHPRPCPRVFLMLSSCLRVLHPPAPDLLQHVPCHLSTLTNLQGSLCLCLSLGHPLLSRLAKTSCGRVKMSTYLLSSFDIPGLSKDFSIIVIFLTWLPHKLSV